LAKPPLAPASSYELEATDLLAHVMRNGNKLHRLIAASVLLMAAVGSKTANGKSNGNGNGK
jgi:hypothetical protein